MKFVQVHTFYGAYLEWFYNKNPELRDLPYQKQMAALRDDGFSAVHIIAPQMNSIGYDGSFIIANNMYSQLMWARENNLNFLQSRDLLYQILKAQLEMLRPEIIYFSDPITFDSNFIRSLTHKPEMILGWRNASIPEHTDFSEFDLMLTSDSGVREKILRHGAKNSIYSLPSVPSFLFDMCRNVEKDTDLVFTGQISPEHTKRIQLLSEISKAPLSGEREFSIGYYLSTVPKNIPIGISMHNKGARWGEEMYKVLKRGKIVFNAHIDFSKNEAGNMRMFETLSMGSFLLTEHFQNINSLFEPGKEIETYQNKDDLFEKINFYLDHEAEREQIAASGRKRCRENYSMEQRALEFDAAIKKHLKRKNDLLLNASVAADIPSDMKMNKVNEILGLAYEEINNSNIKTAFDLLIKAKALKVRVENLDLLRAICFIKLNDMSSAKQALLEELSEFPGNNTASGLLQQFGDDSQSLCEDKEFNEIFTAIRPYTMLSPERLYSLYSLAKRVCESNIQGDIVECGVARGGSSALLATVIKRYSKIPRKLYSLDTFEGMPEPSKEDVHGGVGADETGWGSGTCAGSKDNLVKLCNALGVSDIVVPVKGLFQYTLPVYKDKIGNIALLHMDGDWYESTKAILDNVYSNVTSEGFVQVDDYGHWEGCRKAVDEYFKKHSISVKINQIDATGVWFQKPAEGIQNNRRPLRMVNIGCGSRFHKNWLNMDVAPLDESVKQIDIMRGIPMEAESADVIYHSHLLEHLPKHMAPGFISECYRVLRKGGVMRVVVPDLEQIARLYIEYMEKALGNDKMAEARYDWIMLEMFDQMVRNYSGGEMLKYWQREIIPDEEFIIKRVGSEAKSAIESIRKNGSRGNTGTVETDPGKIGAFRLSGEVHQWMYDRYSLGRLLKDAGFNNIKVCKADESRIPGFNAYLLDIEADGSVRKPDSLFMEAIK